ncbi:hypothetical protein, partial [Aliarcobacter butzleri]
ATLGQGNVTVKDVENSDELDRLNRDTENINKDLYSSSTGTKVDATLDTRLLTEEGRKQIAEDIERTKRLGQAIGDVASSDSLNISDTFNHIGDVQKDLDVQKALALNDKGQTINILENQQNYSQEQIDKALNDYAQIYASVYGINIENAKMAVLNGKYGSTYTNKDNTNSNIYLDKGNNQNALNTANTLGHEVAHVRQNQRQTYLRDTLQLQEEYANLFGNYSSSGLDFSSYVYNNVKLDSNKINSLNSINDLYALYQNSVAYKKDVAKVNSGDGRIDNLTYEQAKKVVKESNGNLVMFRNAKDDGGYSIYDYSDPNAKTIRYDILTEVLYGIKNGFQGFAGGLNRLDNIDTSKMTPEQKLTFELLMLKKSTNTNINESPINLLDKVETVDDTIELYEDIKKYKE